jgi:hypothetical protein
MKRIVHVSLALAVLLAAPRVRGEVDETRYAWEFPVVTRVAGAADPIAELRVQAQRILDAGRLSPLYLSTSDQESVGYTIYNEPGRIVTTLAWAYPYLTDEQQAVVRAHVAEEFADPVFAPWGVTPQGKNGNTNFPLPRDAGAAREDHPKERWWHGRDDFGGNRPFLHTLYGVWLFGWRSGEWAAIEAAWPAIRSRYELYATTAQARLYGGMGAHIAVARLAHRFGDTTTRDAALLNLRNALTAGLDFTAVETLARGTPGLEWQSPYGGFPSMYDSRMDGTSYRGWMFLTLTPEAGRYLAGENAALRAAVLERHGLAKQIFPLWWLNKASYFTRSWTGDEGSGLLPEVIGMIAPVERWVAETPAATLARQLRGSPQGVGDCYWLEALVQAIEAHGTLLWRDVRHPAVMLEPWRQATFGARADDPRAQLTGDWDGDGLVNLLERALAHDPFAADGPTFVLGATPDVFYQTLTYTEVKEAWDIEYVVETSADLVTWNSGAGHAVPFASLDQGATRQVTVRDALRKDQNPRRFIRLKVRTAGTDVIVP